MPKVMDGPNPIQSNMKIPPAFDEQWNEIFGEQSLADGGLTTDELSEMVKMSRDWVRERILVGVKLGKLRVGRKKCPTLDGRLCWKPTYTPIRQQGRKED